MMISRKVFPSVAVLLAAMSSLAQVGPSERVTIPRDTVVPVVFLDSLSLVDNRPGDLFYARVQQDRDLPRGTKLEGRINRVRPVREGREGVMDAEFVAAILPNGERISINAVPVRLDRTQRGADGRLVAKVQRDRRGDIIGASTLGGLLIGSMMKKPFEGTFVGMLTGMIAAEASRKSDRDQNTVVRRGDQMGAWFDREAQFSFAADRELPMSNPIGEIEIRFEGNALRFDRQRPYRDQGSIYVPLALMCRQINIDLTDVRDSGFLLLERGDSLLKVDRQGANYRLNGERGELEKGIIERDGLLYAPLELLNLLVPGKLETRTLR